MRLAEGLDAPGIHVVSASEPNSAARKRRTRRPVVTIVCLSS